MTHPTVPTEERIAAAIRTHAADVAPPMHTDTAAVLRSGRRRRAARTAGGSLAAVAGVLALGVGGYQLGTAGDARPEILVAETAPADPTSVASVPSEEVFPDPADQAAAVAIVARLGDAPTAADEVPADFLPTHPDPAPTGMAETFRLMGTTPGGLEVFLGLGPDEALCMITVDPNGGGSASCAPADQFAAIGGLAQRDLMVKSPEGVDSYESYWVVPDDFPGVPAGWERATENLVLPGEHPVNSSGQMYGPGLLDSVGRVPDLLAMVGDGGTLGYVVREEYERTASDSGAVLPLWDAEGQTQVDSLTVP